MGGRIMTNKAKAKLETQDYLRTFVRDYFSTEALVYGEGYTPASAVFPILKDTKLAEEMSRLFGTTISRKQVQRWRKKNNIPNYNVRLKNALNKIFQKEEVPLSDDEIAFTLGVSKSCVYLYRKEKDIPDVSKRKEERLVDSLDNTEQLLSKSIAQSEELLDIMNKYEKLLISYNALKEENSFLQILSFSGFIYGIVMSVILLLKLII
jgi:hypothetical protein